MIAQEIVKAGVADQTFSQISYLNYDGTLELVNIDRDLEKRLAEAREPLGGPDWYKAMFKVFADENHPISTISNLCPVTASSSQ